MSRILAIFALVLASQAMTQAGVINTPVEMLDAVSMGASDSAPHGVDEQDDVPFVGLYNQQFGNCSTVSFGSGIAPVLIGASYQHQWAPNQLVLWLVAQNRLLVPSSIPISILKVPISVS